MFNSVHYTLQLTFSEQIGCFHPSLNCLQLMEPDRNSDRSKLQMVTTATWKTWKSYSIKTEKMTDGCHAPVHQDLMPVHEEHQLQSCYCAALQLCSVQHHKHKLWFSVSFNQHISHANFRSTRSASSINLPPLPQTLQHPGYIIKQHHVQ